MKESLKGMDLPELKKGTEATVEYGLGAAHLKDTFFRLRRVRPLKRYGTIVPTEVFFAKKR